ncbi:Alkylglycerone-phosphate synthase (plasmid) [Pseudonocardia dioxanivorans CB1190]|uniref:Alkylglycerone-phosphate synthase n=1 Tax=Pseudonocardia dioxanivorans (strain ATCC 55486 / DSM 44775 / JCM 13855 / CB1190) TaxID=675635 RepID=F2L6H8_PSEUX|nr:FAD-binding oxidoreductase [Pseudonocardia dioxanivorans]AEA28872.1 Alkylglycerone-phosphate synthase [Pseudonocardia dioxanivorans CB1190]
MSGTGTRSWWGWGTTEDAVEGDELDAVVERARELAPHATLVDHPPPAVADLDLPEPRVAPPASLAKLCSTDPEDRAGHAHGKSFRDVVRNLHGDLRHVPDLVARPNTEPEVTDLLDWCAATGCAAIPYGGGSSVVGGVEPRFDGRPAVTIDLGCMDQVLETERTSRTARIQAGVLGPALEDQLRRHGLSLRHFPQSFAFSSLGGWLATRAGGHYATRLTHIDDMTEALRVVTPVGVSESRRLPGSGAGPSPDRLFLGSEGILGIITEAWVRLQDRPRWRAGTSMHFETFDDAVDATRAVVQSGLDPANCRLLDPAETFLNTGRSTAGGMLVLGFESADHPVDTYHRRAVELCRDHGGTVPDEVATEGAERPEAAWRSAFLRMPYRRDALARHAMIVETFETACTWDRFPALHQAITGAARRALRDVTGGGVLTCRFTHVYPDGPAPYYSVYAPGRWGSTVAQWDEIKTAVSEALLAHGGTITHHHAVGRDHRPWYDRQRPDPFASALTATKRTLDPAGVLNPGVLITPSEGSA